MDRLLFPRRKRWNELHIVVLQHTETERTQCVVRMECDVVCQADLHPVL